MFARCGSGTFLVQVIAATALAFTSGKAAAAGCEKISGKFTLQSVTGPECQSPVGVCIAGEFRGDLKGTSFFTGTALLQTVDTPTTAVILLTGDVTFQPRDGSLTTKDAVVLRTAGNKEFAEVHVVVSGTGAWAGATGAFTATGTFDTSLGGSGQYEGQICTP